MGSLVPRSHGLKKREVQASVLEGLANLQPVTTLTETSGY